jgi:hypothetical protein
MPLLLYHRGTNLGTYCIGGWVGPIASLEILKKRKSLAPTWI